jgi:hypothetical protein
MMPDWTHPVELGALSGTSIHPDLARVVHFYSRLSEGRAMPHRSEFRPSTMRWMLGRLYLLDVLDGGADYRFRLFGVFWQAVFGADLTGLRLSQLAFEGGLDKLRADYDTIATTGMPALCPRRVKWPDDTVLEFQRLLLPYADDAGQVSLILGAGACDKSAEDQVFFKGSGISDLVPESLTGSGRLN